MEAKKKIEIVIETTDGRKVKDGDLLAFSCGGRTLFCVFSGIDSRGNWKFKGEKQFAGVTFSVAPRIIDKMFFMQDVLQHCEGKCTCEKEEG